MNPTLAPELQEAYALAPSEVSEINCIEITHPGILNPIYLVQGFLHRELTIDGDVKVHRACPFDFIMPTTDDGGLQELTITIDDVDWEVSDFCEVAQQFAAPVTIRMRTFLSTDLTNSLMEPPIRLFLLNVTIQDSAVAGRAVPIDLINMPYPSVDYTRTNHPSLGN